MGGAATKLTLATRWEQLNSQLPDIEKDSRLYASLGLKPADIHNLLRVYYKIDVDRSGFISVSEMLDFFQSTKSGFVKKAFSVFDENYDDKISFKEFVTSLWNYCTLADGSLPLFTFDIYDHDSNGLLELKEVFMMFHDFYGNAFMENSKVKSMLDTLKQSMKKSGRAKGLDADECTLGGLSLSINEFKMFCQQHKMLLAPAYVFQKTMRDKICGMSFWKKCSKRRVVLTSGDDVDAARFLNAATKYSKLKNSSFVVKVSVSKEADNESIFLCDCI